MKNKLFTCGTFAKICGVEKHILFHYDDIDLFKPEYVDDNGYRYYSYHQYDTFKVIMALKKLGMSLKDIQVYLNTRSPDLFLELLDQQESILTDKINELKQINKKITTFKKSTKNGLRAKQNEITIEEVKETNLLLSENLENTTSKGFAGFMNNYTSFIENNNIITGEFVGLMTKVENVQKDQLSNYSYLYTTVDKSSKLYYVKKSGKYLCSYHYGDYDNLDITYKKLINYANKHNLQLDEYVFEEYLIFDICEPNKDKYITRLSVRIKE